jgi:aerobic-type carbon monoxide dehydrogenase small subunit (CoxS/CutS family)
MISLTINGKAYQVDAAPEVPLLWVLREHLKLTGTKYGCGIGACGSCTVHIDGKAQRSCQVTADSAQGKKITTIEAVGTTKAGRAVQEAWIAEDVPQCGYCQSGHIMEAAALLSENPKPSDADVDAAMNGNLCRCGTYQRIRKAVLRASGTLAKGGRP